MTNVVFCVAPSGNDDYVGDVRRALSLWKGSPGKFVFTSSGGVYAEQVTACRNVQRFRGGLVFKAHGLLYHSTLGLRVIKREERSRLPSPSSLLLSSLELSDTKVYEP